MTREWWRGRLADAAFAVAAVGAALVGLDAIFGGRGYLWLGLIGAGAAVLASALTVRVPVLVTVATATVIFAWAGVVAVFGGDTVAGVLPRPSVLVALSRASFQGWRDIVTTLPPVTGQNLLAIPYLLGFAGTLAGVQLAWRTRAAAWPLAGPLATLAGVILLGTDNASSAFGGGVAFAAIGLAWSVLRRRRAGREPGSVAAGGVHRPGGAGRNRLAATGLLLASVGATALVALTPLGTGGSRFVLRDHVHPPFDVSAYPSPLSSYRRYEVNEKDSVLFTVSGLPAGARIRLATMDSYDGVVWGVAGGPGHTQASGVFQRVGDPIPVPEPGAAATVTVTLGSLGGVWLPTVGEMRSVRFGGARAADLTESFRYNLTTAAAVVPVALAPDDQYTMSVVVPPVPDPQTLAGYPAGSVTQPDLTRVPDEVASKAEDWTKGLSGPVKQLQAIVARMRDGAFSDGTVESTVVSLPGAGEHRIQTFLTAPQLVGDGEQYAATLALMARSLGIPARVVLGVVPPAGGFDGTVTGRMVSAWVEVNISGAGWVPLDPTPPVTNKPKPQPTEQLPNSVAQVIAPPVVQAQAANEQPTDGAGGNLPRPPSRLSLWWDRLLTIGEYGGFELAGVGAVLLGIVLAKRSRRSRRRRRGPPLLRITEAWTELTERLGDLGIGTQSGTRRQGAYAAGFPQVAWIADRVDEAVFAPGQPTDEAAAGVWDDVEALLVRLRRTRGRARRFRAAVDPRSLRPRAGWAVAVRTLARRAASRFTRRIAPTATPLS